MWTIGTVFSTVGVQNKPHVRVLLFELNYGWFMLTQVLWYWKCLMLKVLPILIQWEYWLWGLAARSRNNSFRFSILSCNGNTMVWPILCQPQSHSVLTRPTSHLFLTDQDRNKVEEERINRTRNERNYLISGNDVFNRKTSKFNSTDRSKKSNAWYRTFWSQVNGTNRVKSPFTVSNAVRTEWYGTF